MHISVIIGAGIISFLTALWLIKRTHKFGLIDIPNARSSHSKPTPTGGGVGIVLGILAVFGVLFLTGALKPEIKHLIVMAGFLAVALIGFYSDRFNLSTLKRIIFQSIIAGIMIWLVGRPTELVIGSFIIPLGYFGIMFGLIWIVGVTNFYNFMDGIDGLAAMQGIIAGIGIAIFGVILNDKFLISMGLVLSGATAGFLVLNFPPAKIFMGDSGSYPIGFYIASYALINGQLLIPIAMVLGVFIFDPIITLIRRISKGEEWYKAHRSHFYQRAIKLGYSHLQVTSVVSLLSLLLTGLGCIYLQVLPSVQIVVCIVALLALIGPVLWIISKEKNTEGR